jgi:hypothetical protein
VPVNSRARVIAENIDTMYKKMIQYETAWVLALLMLMMAVGLVYLTTSG